MLGFHFFNKGTDRLIHIWKEKFLNEDAMLLIIGKISNDYEELKNEVRNINARDNVVVIDKYVDDNLLNFAVYKSKCIILPYRHASMSGVIYSAAEYSKPVLCTNVGALPEYLEDGVDSFVCNNDDISLEMRLREIINIDSSQLKIMGEKLNDDIHRKYSWDNITKDLFEKIYVKEN
jgi:glycosyltransferase involved in cell wall biosynthesis